MSVTNSAHKLVKKQITSRSIWIRDASGHRSVSVTLLAVSFIVTTIAFVLSLFSKIGPVEIRSFDVGACSVYLVPILSLYFGRKWSDGANGITQAQIAANPVVPEVAETGIIGTQLPSDPRLP